MKMLKTVVKVVAIVATIASFIPGPWQPLAATIAAIATVASTALEVIAPTKPGRSSAQARGSPSEYRLDPQAGIPYMIGRTQFAGNCVKRETWGVDNEYQCFTSVYSYGPIESVESFTADRTPIGFSGNAATGALAGFMWFVSQLGLCPSPVMASPVAGLPGWGANSKLSGLAASHWVLKFDTKGKKFTAGPPQPGIIGRGVLVYDPRKDSTYPGGSGPCRALDETTYVASETPHLHALTYALGRYQNGKKRFGIGFPVNSIDMAYFVNAANVDEANGWKIGGVVYSTDNKWNTLKQMMEAGGGQPITTGARLSGLQSAPKAATLTVTQDDIVGRCSLAATKSFRERINVGIPRYRSEDHGWEYVPANPCRVASYIVTDGGEKSREYPWDLVQQAKQAAQLTYYAMYNAREMMPIELTLKLRFVGLKPGDCVTLNIPALNLVNQKCVCISRSFDVETGAVTARFQTENDAKHAAALAAAGAPIPTTSLSYDPDNVPAAPSGWTIGSGGLATSGGTVPTLRFSFAGTIPLNVEEIEFSHRKSTDVIWTIDGRAMPDATRYDVSAVAPGSSYYGRVRYIVNGKASLDLIIGPVTVETLTASGATIANSIVGQGALATLNSADFTTQVSGAGKPAEGASATSSYTVVDGTYSIQGNKFIKTSGSGWNSAIYAPQSLTGNASLRFRFTDFSANTLAMVGFSTQPTVGGANSYTTLDYYWYHTGPSTCRPGAAGVGLGANVAYDPNTTFSITYDGIFVKFWADSTLVMTVNAGAGKTLWFKATPFTTGTGVFEMVLGPYALVPDLNSNVYDLAGTSPYVRVPRVELRTPLGVAASVAGQTSWATDTTLTPGVVGARTQRLSGGGNLDRLDSITLRRLTLLKRADDVTDLTEAMAITNLGIAASIAGQTAWATDTTLTPGLVGQRTQRLQSDGYIEAGTIYKSGADFLTNRWPSEGGANITESRVAAAFSGQGPWATEGTPPARLLNRDINYFPYPTGVVDGRTASQLGWQNDVAHDGFGNIQMLQADWIGGGYYQIARNGSYGSTGLYPYYEYVIDPAVIGNNFAISLKGYAANGVGFFPYLQFVDSGGNQIGATANLSYVASLDRYEYGEAIRAGTVLIRLICYGQFNASAGYQDLTWTNIKLEFLLGQPVSTPYRADVPTMRRTSRLSPTNGRVVEPRFYNTQNLIGVGNTTNLTPTYTVGGSNVTVTLPAHTRKIAGPNGAVTLSYGSASGVVAFSSYWFAYIDDPDLTGNASPSVVFTTNPDDLLAPNRYWIASGQAPNSGGGGGSTGSGGGDDITCVAADSFMPTGGTAEEVKPGDFIRLLDESSWAGSVLGEVTHNATHMAECVELRSSSGIRLVVSQDTPCTLQGGAVVPARFVAGDTLAVEDAAGFRWERIEEARPVGMRPVSFISADGGTYAAGKEEGRYIYTHNVRYKAP